MAAAKAAYVCLILSVGLSIAKACVLLECLTPTADPPKYHFGGIHHWLIIFAIVVACVVGLVLLILLIWLACWCCYRCDTQSAPNVVRRVVLRRREYVPQRKVNFNVTPPPPPVVHQPSEKIVVIQPAPVTPQSLLLTVSENPNYTTAGPLMSTRLEQPLTFTLTPEFGNQQRDLSVYEAQRIRNDFTPLTLGHINNGCTECQYHQ